MDIWVPTKTVAEIMGMSVRGLIKMADRENWQTRPRQAQGGGKEYHISSLPRETQRALKIRASHKQRSKQQTEADNNARLKGQLAGMELEAEQKKQDLDKALAFNRLNSKEQARVRARAEVLAAWEIYVTDFEAVEPATREFVEAFNQGQLSLPDSVYTFVRSVSRASLMRWKASYAEKGPAGLACSYKGVRQSIVDSQPRLRDFIEAMLAVVPHTTPANMMRAMEGEFDQQEDIQLPSKRALSSWLASWKVKNQRLFTAVANPDAYKNKYMVAAGDAREGIDRLNQLWEMDSSPADVMCTDGRFSLIACVDVYSGRAVLKVRKNSDSYGIALTMRQAMLEWGLDGECEQKIRVDNGQDYASHYMYMVADTLGVELLFTQPFAGEQKPFVERLFRTFSHGLVELLPGYIGHNVADRKEIEARFSFADRLRRKTSGKSVIDITMSSEDLQNFCDRWVNAFYMHEPHSGLNGETPAQRVQNWVRPVLWIEDVRALDLLLEPIPGSKGERTVQKKGIKLDGGWYIAPELGSRVGDRLMVRYDNADLGRIYLFDDSGTFVCIAQNPTLTGVSRKELAQAMKQEEKKIAEEKAELRAKGRKINQAELVEKILAAKERKIAEQYANVTPLPKKQLDHTTSYLAGAADALAAAEAESKGSGHVDEFGQPSQDLALGMNQVVTDRVKQREDPAETPTDRFQRWIRQHERKLAGETLNEMDQRWQERFELTPEWHGLKLVYDEFGKMAFGMKEE